MSWSRHHGCPRLGMEDDASHRDFLTDFTMVSMVVSDVVSPTTCGASSEKHRQMSQQDTRLGKICRVVFKLCNGHAMNSSKLLFGSILRAVFSNNTYERDSRAPQVPWQICPRIRPMTPALVPWLPAHGCQPVINWVLESGTSNDWGKMFGYLPHVGPQLLVPKVR